MGDARRKCIFSTADEDAKRRDFTINGMFFDPENGEVIDLVGGRADLDARLIRAIGDPDQRLTEDRLRMLRAVRFATVFGFEIESGTWKALVSHAASISDISAERIREELVRIFMSPQRVRGWDLLDASGLMRVILPELEAMKGCEQPRNFIRKEMSSSTRASCSSCCPRTVSLPLVFSVLFHDIGKPPTASVDGDGRIRFNGHDRVGAEMTEEIMERLRFSRAEIDATVEMVRQHMVFKDVPKMRVAKLKRFMARPTFTDELELHRVDCASSHACSTTTSSCSRSARSSQTSRSFRHPSFGEDLIALGLRPGPQFTEILEAIETRQLGRRLQGREEALEWVKHMTISRVPGC